MEPEDNKDSTKFFEHLPKLHAQEDLIRWVSSSMTGSQTALRRCSSAMKWRPRRSRSCSRSKNHKMLQRPLEEVKTLTWPVLRPVFPKLWSVLCTCTYQSCQERVVLRRPGQELCGNDHDIASSETCNLSVVTDEGNAGRCYL